MSDVGSLLYLVKHSRPNLSNVVHELSKFMGKSNPIHYKVILCAIKYIIYTKYYCYHMKLEVNLNGPQELHIYSDTDHTLDNNTCKIVTGYIV